MLSYGTFNRLLCGRQGRVKIPIYERFVVYFMLEGLEMYFKFKPGIIFSIIVFPLFTTQAVGRNDLAVKKFESAISACEKGLQMNMPKSKGSLTILQNLFKKYQRHRDAALAMEGSLKSSEEERYAGSFFSKRSFLEIYQICERELTEKVAQAETKVADKMKNLDNQQAQSEADIQVLLEKNHAAKQQLVLAIDKHCASYLLKPEGGISAPVYKEYQAAKQQALQTYPAIVNQFHTVAFTDSATGEAKNVNKTVQAWFDHCDTAFTGPATPEKPATVASNLAPVASDEEGPMRTSPEEESTVPPPAESVAASAKEGVTPSSPPSEQVSPPATTPTAPEPIAPPTTVAEKTTTPSPPTEIAMATSQAPTTEMTSPPEPSLTSPQLANPDNSAENDKTASPNNRASSKNSAAPTTENAQEANGDNAEDDENDAENVDDEMAEYRGVMAKAQGDRLKILKDEKRLPEFVDDQDFNYLKAKIWQYEKPTGDKCNIYTFKGNQLIKTVKNFSGACPPLEPQD